jgi:thiol:disulfide interchange protein
LRRFFGSGIALLALVAVAAADPFDVRLARVAAPTGVLVKVSFTVPPDHYLYADQITVETAGGVKGAVVGGDRPASIHDSFSEGTREAFTQDVTIHFLLPATAAAEVVKVGYQGCDATTCFFPQERRFEPDALGPGRDAVETAPVGAGATDWRTEIKAFRMGASAAGYLKPADFLAFLDRAEGRAGSPPDRGGWARVKQGFLRFSTDPLTFFNEHGAGWTLLLILLGGLLLNLTPCVLPMIPINLAILGAGTTSGRRGRGFLLGLSYGLGIAMVYGALGLVVVLTGAQFGTLNSMPAFNAAIGVLFVALGLAMFDVMVIDLSRFQRAGTGWTQQVGPVAALAMGGVAALLAGACVAPVVIAVLLLAGSLYAAGATVAAALPFLLGVGMALPWPFAGAGLSFLPKPGRWMTWVKYGFGLFILLFAFYYFSLAYQGWRGGGAGRALEDRFGAKRVTPDQMDAFAAILHEAKRENRPVFIDFWATWCKNCEAMEATTFRDAGVARRLAAYTVVKLRAESPAEAATREVTDYFGVRGLPTYVILSPLP